MLQEIAVCDLVYDKPFQVYLDDKDISWVHLSHAAGVLKLA